MGGPTVSLLCSNLPQQLPVSREIVPGNEIAERVENRCHLASRCPRIQRAVKMRVQLPLLSRHRARGDDAEISGSEIDARPRQNLAVAINDHPFVERGVQIADVLAKFFIVISINDRAGCLAARSPAGEIVSSRFIVFGWRDTP